MIRKVPPCLEGLVSYAAGHLATDESNGILIPEAVSAASSVSGERFFPNPNPSERFFVLVLIEGCKPGVGTTPGSR